jgi:hypothetical protein
VSSHEIEAESLCDPICEALQEEQSASSTPQQQQKKPESHPGRNELPVQLPVWIWEGQKGWSFPKR